MHVTTDNIKDRLKRFLSSSTHIGKVNVDRIYIRQRQVFYRYSVNIHLLLSFSVPKIFLLKLRLFLRNGVTENEFCIGLLSITGKLGNFFWGILDFNN